MDVMNLDVIDLLVADHNRVRGLFARYHQAHDADRTDESSALASKITTELEVHTTIEEEVFYPAVRKMSEELAEAVDEGIEEHHVCKILLSEIKALKPESDEWAAKMTVMIENTEHHVKEEEDEMFPKVRSNSDARIRNELGEALEKMKASLGAPTIADKDSLSKVELDEMAREQQIPGRSSMKRDELEATVGLDS